MSRQLEDRPQLIHLGQGDPTAQEGVYHCPAENQRLRLRAPPSIVRVLVEKVIDKLIDGRLLLVPLLNRLHLVEVPLAVKMSPQIIATNGKLDGARSAKHSFECKASKKLPGIVFRTREC
eukprot:scaffold37790_cov28-Tisochrysis_lutea.AAC.2